MDLSLVQKTLTTFIEKKICNNDNMFYNETPGFIIKNEDFYKYKIAVTAGSMFFMFIGYLNGLRKRNIRDGDNTDNEKTYNVTDVDDETQKPPLYPPPRYIIRGFKRQKLNPEDVILPEEIINTKYIDEFNKKNNSTQNYYNIPLDDDSGNEDSDNNSVISSEFSC